MQTGGTTSNRAAEANNSEVKVWIKFLLVSEAQNRGFKKKPLGEVHFKTITGKYDFLLKQ